MPAYVFHLTVRDGQHDRLREINDRYAGALDRVGGGIAGLGGIEKYVLGDEYVERVDYAGDFADFAKQLSADSEIRQFLREVNGCFVQSLRDMSDRQMTCIQEGIPSE